MVRRVEWIGVEGPLNDERITYRKIRGLYTSEEEVLLEAVTEVITPMIRVPNGTARAKGKADGYEKDYLWRWRTNRFICEMTDKDAERLFREDPDEAQFKDLDNPDHEDRKPQVPWMYITKALHRIMEEARNGPGLVLRGSNAARTLRSGERLLNEWQEQRAWEAKDRGWTLDPKSNRLVPPSQ